MLFITKNEEETYELASKIAAGLIGGEIIILEGELGAGKTTFTKGLAKALGVTEEITSPTFIMMKEYEGRLKLYHFDLYRIEDECELEELGFSDYMYNEGVCVIEWNKFKKFPVPPIHIKIEYIDENSRSFDVEWTF